MIVDEAHTAARPGVVERFQHQRFELIRDLASDPNRHVILVTATPHSGIEESFRSLLGLLDPAFDVMGPAADDLDRRRLVPHVVQRRRADLERWLGAETPFPKRNPKEQPYQLTPEYQSLFSDVLDYCRETVGAASGLRAHQRRVRHWAAIALLRCVLSSPAAAEAVMAGRAGREGLAVEVGLDSADEVDAVFGPQVLDPIDDEQAGDYLPTAPIEEAEPLLSESEGRRLAGFIRRARALADPEHDAKLKAAAGEVARLLRGGFHPIVFCRFIATANYLAATLPKVVRADFPDVRAVAVTGEVGDEERRAKVAELAGEPHRVLVATDCLSEGINLQEHFDAVVHYDLPWNPNRLEQREGRIDRFGQPRAEVETVLLYGADNPVDLVVLDVLIRKAKTIRSRLGVSVPVPVESDQIVQTVVDTVLLRGVGRAQQLQLPMFGEDVGQFHAKWEAAAEREGRQRTYFAQHGIQPAEVAREIEATDPVLGDADAVRRFVAAAVERFAGRLRPAGLPGVFDLDCGDLRVWAHTQGALQDRAHTQVTGAHTQVRPYQVTFAPMAGRAARAAASSPAYLGRTHPIVEACCRAVLGAALSADADPTFARAGAIFTDAVSRRAVVVLLRLRYLLREETDQFAEEIVIAGFERGDAVGAHLRVRPNSLGSRVVHAGEGAQAGEGAHVGAPLRWIEPFETAARLVEGAKPVANMPPGERSEHVAWALDFLRSTADWYAPVVDARVRQLQASHDRLRKLARHAPLAVEPHLPPDILGCYVLVPARGGG